MLHHLRDSWEKNWPEVRCAATGSLPEFVLSRNPEPLKDSVPVFCYHVVSGPDFEKDLLYLKQHGYRTLRADELLARLKKQAAFEEPAVVLTFDDCSLNFFQVAFPLLQKYGCHAVAFVAPHFHDLAEAAKCQGYRPCSWEELAVIHRSGLVDVQSHTFEHRYLPRWPEPVPLCGTDAKMNTVALEAPRSMEDDLLLAKEVLEQRLGSPVRHLAFPRYEGTDEAIRIGRAVGYEGFWWGVIPGRPTNRQGDSPDQIVRISGEFLRRLPGEGRISLTTILRARYGQVFRRWTNRT